MLVSVPLIWLSVGSLNDDSFDVTEEREAELVLRLR